MDCAALQDGFQISHHAFLFNREGRWWVVPQGMSGATGMARRYHWNSAAVAGFVGEPHLGIVGLASVPVLNLVAREGDGVRKTIAAPGAGGVGERAVALAGPDPSPAWGRRALRVLALLVELLDGVLGRAVRRARLGARDEPSALRWLAQTGPSLTTRPPKRQLERG